MKLVHSMVVAFDGESKCGKTTIINNVRAEAEYQAEVGIGVLERSEEVFGRHIEPDPGMEKYLRGLMWRNVTTLSAGNKYRAAAYYAIQSQRGGRHKESFGPDDVDPIRELLVQADIEDFLQNDLEVAARVTPNSRLPGIQALCGTLFCDDISRDYHAGGGANLVIVDARDPVGHMRRNDLIGIEDGRIHPASVLPLYIDTPDSIAAGRIKGDFEDNLAMVRSRRHDDRVRQELPVRKPPVMVHNFNTWLQQLGAYDRRHEIILPYYLDNGENSSLGSIQYLAGHIAVAAQDQGYMLQQTLRMTPDEIEASMQTYTLISSSY